MAAVLKIEAPREDIGDAGFIADFDAEALETKFRVFRLMGIVVLEDFGGIFNQDDAEFAGIDAAEVCFEGPVDEIRAGTGKLDSGGAATDNGDCHEAFAFIRIPGEFGSFQIRENFPADVLGIGERFQTQRVSRPLIISKIPGLGTDSHDQCIKTVGCPRCAFDGFSGGIDGRDFVHEDSDVPGFLENLADGTGNIGSGQGGGGDLIEERLEKVVVGAIDKDHGKAVVIGEFPGAFEAGKAPAEDKNLARVEVRAIHGARLPRFELQGNPGL